MQHSNMATSAVALAPNPLRQVFRCFCCLLVQFDTAAHTCRRCKASLDPAPQAPAIVPVPASPLAMSTLATVLRELRLRAGLSQRQLAARLPGPRSYVSKLENEKATPTLSSLERVATALGVTVAALLTECERGTSRVRSELLADPWVASLAPFVSSLSLVQRSALLAELSAMTRRSRATAA
jgi:transcriptional regulator with XRE-family HTH domain